MATTYTLSDGVHMRLADGLSDEQVLEEADRIANNTIFDTKDIEDTYNIVSGVQDSDLRLSLALADGNQEETTLVLDNKVGKGNWGYTDQGFLFVTPEGLERRGIQSDKSVLVNGSNTTLNDFVDVIPEITVGLAAGIAEVALPFIPGSGVIARGFLSPLVSRGLLASSFRAGAGDIAANIGLEELQKARGENVETASEIYTAAGIEGAVVTAASVALGLPFKLTGKLGGKLSQAAKNKMGDTTTDGIAVTANSAQEARASAIEALQATGKYSAKEIEELVPVITIKHMLGDEGSLTGKFATVLEGIGAKNVGDKLPADALIFLQKFDDLYRNAKIKGMGPVEIIEQMKSSLTKAELDLLGKTQKNIDNFYTKVGATMDNEKEVSFLTDLISTNILKQFNHGQSKFKEMYGKLNLEGFSEYRITNSQVASLIKNISKAQNTTPDATMNMIQAVDANLANRINKAVTFKGTNRDPVGKKAKKNKNKKTSAADNLNRVNARDLYNLGQHFRSQAKPDGSNINKTRLALKADEVVTKAVNDAVGNNFGADFTKVQKAYSKFIQPYNKRVGLLEKTTKQNPEEYVKQLVSGAKSRTFSDIVENLDLILKGTDDIGNKAFDVLDADALLGKVGTQYMRYAKDKYKLTNIALTPENIPELRSNAKRALKALDDLQNTGEFTQRHKKAFKRMFSDEGFNDYKKALKQIADGKPEGLGKLQQALSYKEAESFIGRISELGDNLSGSGKLPEALAELRRYKQVDPRGAEFYNDLLYSQIYSRLLKVGGKDAQGKNNAIKKWAEDIVSANNINKEAMEELLGANYKPIMDMGNIIQGAFNVDPTAGAISAAGLPIGVIRGGINMSVVGALKPLSLMYTLKSFAPGGAGWLKINRFSKVSATEDKLSKPMSDLMSKTIKKARKTASLTMAGRNGLLAATVSSYMDEADTDLPPVDSPNVNRSQIQEEVPEQNQATAEQQLGQNMVQQQALMNQLQGTQAVSPQQPARLPPDPVQQGAQIAQNTQSAVGNPALSLSITANSIPNSFANLMGSINMGKG